MERMRFGEQEGPNGRKTILNGWLAVFAGGQKTITIELSGPNGGVHTLAVIDKATAGKLGAALLKWAGVDTMDVLIAEQKRLLAEMNQGSGA